MPLHYLAVSRLNAKLFFLFHNFRIVNDEIIFVRSKVAKAEHTKRYVSISISEDSCKKNSSERVYLILRNGNFNTPKNASPKIPLDIFEVPSSRSVKTIDSSRKRKP